MMGPVVEKCAEAYAGKMKIGKLNVDDNMTIAQKYRVVSIPHFIVFKNGEPAVTFGGAMSEADFCRKLDQVLASLESYAPCIVKTETAIWELAHKSLFLFLTIYGDSRQ